VNRFEPRSTHNQAPSHFLASWRLFLLPHCLISDLPACTSPATERSDRAGAASVDPNGFGVGRTRMPDPAWYEVVNFCSHTFSKPVFLMSNDRQECAAHFDTTTSPSGNQTHVLARPLFCEPSRRCPSCLVFDPRVNGEQECKTQPSKVTIAIVGGVSPCSLALSVQQAASASK
jgi:hypothetical protein